MDEIRLSLAEHTVLVEVQSWIKMIEVDNNRLSVAVKLNLDSGVCIYLVPLDESR